MKRLTVSDAETVRLALRDEIRRSDESRYCHRLHVVLLVAQGMHCAEVGRLLGDSTRSVQNWVHRFAEGGFAGLLERKRPGRPSRLSETQMAVISRSLRESSQATGMPVDLRDGKMLARLIESRMGIKLSVRQCQRLLRRL